MENYETAVVFGRFNLLHNGHVQLFTEMAKIADRVVIGLSTNSRNLPSEDRSAVIETVLSEIGIKFSVLPAAQPFEIFERIDSERVVTYFGEDQFKLGAAAQRVYGWPTKTIPRITSSTVVRELIDQEEWDILASIVPKSVFAEVIRLRKLELNQCQDSL